MPAAVAARYLTRRWLVGLAVVGVALLAGLALAGTVSILNSWIGHTAAALMSPLFGITGAVLLWPAIAALRTWSGIPGWKPAGRNCCG